MDVRRLVLARHTGVAAERIVALGRGCDHECYLVDDRLVVRRALSETGDVEREARLLALVAEVCPLPVPEPVFVAPDEGWLAYRWIAGVPLLEVGRSVRARHAERVARQLGRALRALHSVASDRLAGLVERDDAAPADLLGEARAHYTGVSGAVPAGRRPAVEAFLECAPPPAAPAVVFTHNDLGIEHVLITPETMALTGIIDWSDAALADPARDLGLLLRDLGPAALAGERDEALRARAWFHARCALLEDLAYGLANDRSAYVAKSRAGLSWLFA